MRRAQQSKPEGVGVIGKVFQILEAIQSSPSGLTLKPICDITGVHKSTAHRFLKHLQRDGYILRTQEGTYMIGPRLSQMGARSSHRVTLQAVAPPDSLGTVEVDGRDGESGDPRSGHSALC